MTRRPSPAAADPNRRGIALMVAGSALFALNDAMSKLMLAQHMPPSQIMALRGLTAAIAMVAVLALRGRLADLRYAVEQRTLMRGALEATGAFLFISAIGVMSIADATAVLQMSPVLTMLAAVALIGSRLGWRRWIAVAVGLVGTGLIIKPGGSAFTYISVLPLATALIITLRDFVTGRIGAQVPSLVIALTTALAGMGLGFAGAMVETWQPLDLTRLALVAGAATTLLCGHVLVIAAFRGTDPATIAPFRYSSVVGAVFLGATLFGIVPDAVSIAGMALIVAAGIYTVRDSGRPRLDPPPPRERVGDPVGEPAGRGA